LAKDQGWAEKISYFFKKKESVLVLGLSGTGKSNLLTSLSAAGGLVDALSAEDRTVSAVHHKVTINDKPFVVIDTPGESQHRSLRRTEIVDLIRRGNGKARIINVVSYGYHEYGAGRPDAITSSKKPRTEFLERNRQNEIHALAEWVASLGSRETTAWITTVVTKADLWWSEKDTVLPHYQSGAYDAAIRQIDADIHHTVLPYSSVVHKFYGVVPVDGEFDDATKTDINSRFLRKLVDLA